MKYTDEELGITPQERGKYVVECREKGCGIEHQPHTALDHLRLKLTKAKERSIRRCRRADNGGKS